MGKKEISYKARLNADEAFKYVGELLEALKSGACYVHSGDDFIELSPAEQVDLEIEASRKISKGKLSVEIAWSTPLPASQGPELKITTEAPPEPEPTEEGPTV